MSGKSVAEDESDVESGPAGHIKLLPRSEKPVLSQMHSAHTAQGDRHSAGGISNEGRCSPTDNRHTGRTGKEEE